MPVKKIKELFVFVAEDTPEQEGIVAMGTVPGLLMPMVTGESRLARGPLWDTAHEIAKTTGKRIRLVRFSTRRVLDVIDPPRKINGDT